jgi:hypothetical protein
MNGKINKTRGGGETKERTEKEEQWGEDRIKKRRTCGKR